MLKRIFPLALLVGCFQTTVIEDPYVDASLCAETYMKNHQSQQLQFPINVYIHSSISDNDVEVVILATTMWNSAMSAPIFVPIISDDVFDRHRCESIFVKTENLPREGQVGFTSWNSCSAQIKFEPNQIRKLAIVVMIHELGHSLNLEHEDDITSVLHAEVFEDQKVSDLSRCLVEYALRESIVD